jgi:hypothetical protein
MCVWRRWVCQWDKNGKKLDFLSETGRNVKNVELLFGGGVYSHEVVSISGMFWYRVLLR